MKSPGGGAAKERRLVVLAEDAALRELLVDSLVEQGHELASGGASEVERVLSLAEPADLVVAVSCGSEQRDAHLARAMSRQAPQVPVIVVTGYRDDLQEDLSRLASRVLRMPFPSEVLLDAVAHVLAARAAA